MPIYEYACGACGHAFEEWQKMSDPPVKTCPKCKKKKVEKLISQTAFQLKGGGWYKDLYSSSKPGGDSKEGGANGTAAQKSEGGGSGDGGGGGKESSDSGAKTGAVAKGESKPGSKGDVKDAKKKDSPKKSETRAA